MALKDDLGRLGEDLAADELERAGLRIVERNWRCDAGEIDIVATEGRTLVICEVKTRSSTRFGEPIEALTPAKIERIYRLASIYRRTHRVGTTRVRYDVVAIIAPYGHTPDIKHIRGAFG
ncbi:YraN family protein [Cumulibacter soli]|uniref:YraN family protein n=1 Tax=Cumulibacter soli TaxID=2546344 RepID=UPI0010685F2A|nr:YraN family protein [Cumulibacter soli]